MKDEEERKPLSASTPIQIGALVTILALIVGAVWWAATLTGKVDTLIRLSEQNIEAQKIFERRLCELETWRRVVEARTPKSGAGTP